MKKFIKALLIAFLLCGATFTGSFFLIKAGLLIAGATLAGIGFSVIIGFAELCGNYRIYRDLDRDIKETRLFDDDSGITGISQTSPEELEWLENQINSHPEKHPEDSAKSRDLLQKIDD